MPNFTAGTSFTDGVTNDVTAAKLNALIADAVPTSSLSLNSTTGTISNFTSSTANITLGTIPTLTTGTTTGTAATFTTGTLTAGVIPTLTSTTLITSGTGTAASPAIQPTGDTNTGIFFPAADTIAFSEGGTESMRIDSSGNVGIGTNSPSGKLHVIGQTYIQGTVSGGLANSTLIANASGQAQIWALGPNTSTSGSMAFVVGRSDLSNSNQAITIDSSSNVGIGSSSPSSFYSGANNLVIGSGSGEEGVTIYGGNASASYLAFADGTTGDQAYRGSVKYDHSVDSMSLQTGAAERLRIDSSGNVGIGTTSPSRQLHVKSTALIDSNGDGTTGVPSLSIGALLTGFSHIATNNIVAITNGTERLRIDSSGNVGIGTTSPAKKLHVDGSNEVLRLSGTTPYGMATNGTVSAFLVGVSDGDVGAFGGTLSNHYYALRTNNAERLRIDSSGNLLVGKTAPSTSTVGFQFTTSDNKIACGAASGASAFFNRNTDDGIIVQIAQDGTVEGTISVSGTTVSYNGGHLSRFSQLPSGQRDPAIKKGTVMSNLNEMCEWRDKDGNLLPNEQLNRVKISDIEGDSNAAGVFVNWDNDDQDNPFDLNMAMTGDMIIRIAQGTNVNRGDLLMSAGDGTAKSQGDDIIRSKTIAKVTSTNVTCTYEDGSYCVPCVLMAC